jgi:AcrR family transcriptional regulator
VTLGPEARVGPVPDVSGGADVLHGPDEIDAPATALGVAVEGFHPPRQRRSRESLRKLTRAVDELLVAGGPAELSVRDLVARAETSVGAFYSRFDDRDAALIYTSHVFWERSRRLWSEHLAGARWVDCSAAVIVAGVVRTFTRIMLADADRLRAFVRLSLSVPGTGVVEKIGEHDRFIAAAFAELLTSRPGEIRHESPREAAEEGFRHVLARVRDFVVFEGAGPRDPGRERRLILGLCRMYGRYVDIWPVPRSYGELLRLAYGVPVRATSAAPP